MTDKLSRTQRHELMKEIISDEDKLAYYLLRLSTFVRFWPDANFAKRFPHDFQYYMNRIKEEDNND